MKKRDKTTPNRKSVRVLAIYSLMEQIKIATWNLERVPRKKCQAIIDTLINLHADILILTETHKDIVLNESYNYVSTLPLTTGQNGITYKDGEVRTTIATKYPIVKQLPTTDPYTNVAAELVTPIGTVLVLGCIIGIFGNKVHPFKEDLINLQMDVSNLTQQQTIIAGDFNFSFDKYYPSAKCKETLNSICEKHRLQIITQKIPEAVDHIVMSDSIAQECDIELFEWNHDKAISDHKGIIATISIPHLWLKLA